MSQQQPAQQQLTIRLLKPAKDQLISYQATLLHSTASYRLVRAHWSAQMGRVDIGYLVFEPGDYLLEHFYRDRWYNVFALYQADDQFKGWYCNLTRPAVFSAEAIESEDLALDLVVSADRSEVVLLDEDEYAALDLETHEPLAHASVQAALLDLRGLIARGAAPFDPPDQHMKQLKQRND
jgi:hypothetical protein